MRCPHEDTGLVRTDHQRVALRGKLYASDSVEMDKHGRELQGCSVPHPNSAGHAITLSGEVARVITPFEERNPCWWTLQSDFLEGT